MRANGSFTTATPLAANLSAQNIAPQLIAYSFSDGLVSYSMTDPNSRVYDFSVSTGPSGQITSSTTIVLEEWQSVSHTPPSRVAILEFLGSGTTVQAYNNTACNSDGVSPAGTADSCLAALADASASSATGAGAWTVGALTVPTLGDCELFLLAAFLAVVAWLQMRRRSEPTRV